MAWFDFEQDVEARSGQGVRVKRGRATKPSRAQFCHAGAKQAVLRETNQDRTPYQAFLINVRLSESLSLPLWLSRIITLASRRGEVRKKDNSSREVKSLVTKIFL